MGFFWSKTFQNCLLCRYEHFSGLGQIREWGIILLITLALRFCHAREFCPRFSMPESMTSSMVTSAGLALQRCSRKPLSWEMTSEDWAMRLKQQSTVQVNLGGPLSSNHHRFTPLALRTSCFSISETSQGSYLYLYVTLSPASGDMDGKTLIPNPLHPVLIQLFKQQSVCCFVPKHHVWKQPSPKKRQNVKQI